MAAETLTQEISTADNANLVSLQVPLPKLLDLALGTPESLITALKPETLLQFQKYDITNNKDVPKKEDDDTVVEILADDTQVPAEVKVTKGVKQRLTNGKEDRAETVYFVEPIVDETTPTALAVKKLEQTVKELEQRYRALEELAKSPEIIERLKGMLADPVSEVWQLININKRLDANAEGIDKLATMVQDMMIRTDSIATVTDKRLDKLEHKVSRIQRKLIEIQKIIKHKDVDDMNEIVDEIKEENNEEKEENNEEKEENNKVKIQRDKKINNKVKIEKNDKVNDEERKENDKVEIKERNDEILDEIDELTDEITDDTDIVDEVADRRPTIDRNLREIRQDIEALQIDVAVLQNDVAQIQKELQNITEILAQNGIKPTVPRAEPSAAPDIEPTIDGEIVSEVTNGIINLEQCVQVVRTHVKDLRDIGRRMSTLEQEIGDLMDRLDSIQATVSKTDDDETQRIVKIREIEMYIDNLGETMNKLLEDKEKRENDFNTLMEQIEVLKTVKADKEDLEDALAEKADAQAMIRKVSHDKFDSACEDLARGLEEAIDKLAKQEAIWQQALDEVQSEIAGKVDKMEMTPLKDFVNTKLKSLQEKLKIMAEARREIEAAGTKKFLRDVQCISCDKDVVMKTEEVGGFYAEPLPCTTSIKPYLTYKLDQVRKQQKKLPHRNMIQFETAMQEEVRRMKAKEELPKTPRGGHLVNRYCGGSHTTTTPQQRVTRTGHFLTQWGPKVVQMTEGMIVGKDGAMYHSRPGTKIDVCEPACWESSFCGETQSPEHPASAPSPNRKSSRRSNANTTVSQKRNEKRSSKEQKILEPAEKPIEEQETTQEMYTYEADDQ